MVMYVVDVDCGIMLVQSLLGMNLGKVVGYAKGRKVLDQVGVTVVVCGDGIIFTSDFHEVCTVVSVWDLLLVLIVIDNEIVISVMLDEGRGIKDFCAYVVVFNGHYIECNGYDVDDMYA